MLFTTKDLCGIQQDLQLSNKQVKTLAKNIRIAYGSRRAVESGMREKLQQNYHLLDEYSTHGIDTNNIECFHETYLFFKLNGSWVKVLYCVALRCVALRCVALRCVALRCVALRCVALRCVALRCVALRCAALCCAALRCAALRCVALRCVALRCVALRCVQLRGVARRGAD